MDWNRFKKDSVNRLKENKKFLKRLSRENDRKIDDLFQEAHEVAFDKTDCLACANCCKTTSPIFYENDIGRLALVMKMRPGEFIEKYLRVDEDRDYVLKSSPCPFLMADNHCSVYESRPKACREYPHTDRKKVRQVFDLTLSNSLICPAVHLMLDLIKSKIDQKEKSRNH